MKSDRMEDRYFSWQTSAFEMPPPEGYKFMNPAIVKTVDGYTAIIRCMRMEGQRIDTKNLFCRFGQSIFRSGDYIRYADFLKEPDNFPRVPNLQYTGIEDIRLFHFRNCLFGAATTHHVTNGARASMILLSINDRYPNPYISDWRPIPSPGPDRWEKNWMPFVKDEKIMLMYSVEPTRILSEDGVELSSTRFPDAASGLGANLRGGSQIIPFEQGYLAIVHENDTTHGRKYFHRFIYFDQDVLPAALSDRFHFVVIGQEFVTGLCDSHEPDRLMVGYSLRDSKPWFGSVRKAEVLSKLIALK